MGSTASQGSLPTSRSSGESGSEGRALRQLRPGSQRGEGNQGEGNTDDRYCPREEL